MITNTAMDVKHGSKARSNLKASTAKERKMGAAATNGLMEASTKEISSTVSSKDKVSQLLATRYFEKFEIYFCHLESALMAFLLLFWWVWWPVLWGCYLGYCAGVYYFAESERTYEGSFSLNLFEGKGKLTYRDGRQYEGDFRQGKKEGHGIMLLPNGNKYIG